MMMGWISLLLLAMVAMALALPACARKSTNVCRPKSIGLSNFPAGARVASCGRAISAGGASSDILYFA